MKDERTFWLTPDSRGFPVLHREFPKDKNGKGELVCAYCDKYPGCDALGDLLAPYVGNKSEIDKPQRVIVTVDVRWK